MVFFLFFSSLLDFLLGLGAFSMILAYCSQKMTHFFDFLSLQRKGYSDLSVFGLVLFEVVHVIIHEAESGGFASSELSVEPEQNDIFLVTPLGLGKEFCQVLLGNVGELWVVNINDLRRLKRAGL
jgi:hypothetical protein